MQDDRGRWMAQKKRYLDGAVHEVTHGMMHSQEPKWAVHEADFMARTEDVPIVLELEHQKFL